jgi:hypothetical protein
MASVQVTQEDVESIARKLDELSAVLTPREVAVLQGVFGLVGQSIDELAASSPPAGAALAPLADASALSQGFREAFEHGVGTKFTVEPSDAEGQTNVKGSSQVAVDYSR